MYCHTINLTRELIMCLQVTRGRVYFDVEKSLLEKFRFSLIIMLKLFFSLVICHHKEAIRVLAEMILLVLVLIFVNKNEENK